MEITAPVSLVLPLHIYCVAVPLLSLMTYGMMMNPLASELNAWFGVYEFGI